MTIAIALREDYQHLEIDINASCSQYDDESDTPPDSLGCGSQRSWSVVLFAMTTILLYADQNLLAPNLTAIAQEFGFTDEERDQKLGGDLALAFFVLGAPAALLVGCWGDRTKHRTRLFALVVGMGEGACLLSYFSTTYTQLFICRAMTGVSVGGSLPLIYSMLGDLFSSEDRHVVSAMVGAGTGLGISLGQGLAGFLGTTFGWRFPFLVVSVPALVCALLVFLTVQDPERGGMERRIDSSVQMVTHNSCQKLLVGSMTVDHQSLSSIEKQDSELPMKRSNDSIAQIKQGPLHDLFHLSDHWNTFVDLLSTPSVVLCLFQGAPGCVPWGIVNTYLNDYLSEDRGMTVEGATVTVLCFGVGSFGGLVAGGIGGQALYRIDPRYPALLAGIAAISGCIPFWFVLNTISSDSCWWYTGIVTVIAGLCAGITGPIVKANLQNVTVPTARGQAFSLYNTFDDFGRGLGPVFISMLITNFGGRVWAFNIGVVGWIVCGIFNLLIFFTIKQDEQKMQLNFEKYRDSNKR